MEIFKQINALQSELSAIGIAKDKDAGSGNFAYKFRGIDDVYNTLSPLLAKHEIVIIPRFSERIVTEKQKGNSILFYVSIKGEFDFISSKDGSKYTAVTFGEAMDGGDKATNKAMSIAYKYACFQVFAIPTLGDNDPDATIHQNVQNVQNVQPAQVISQAQANELKNILGNLSDVGRQQAMAEMQKCGVASIEQIPSHYFNDWKGFLSKLS